MANGEPNGGRTAAARRRRLDMAPNGRHFEAAGSLPLLPSVGSSDDGRTTTESVGPGNAVTGGVGDGGCANEPSMESGGEVGFPRLSQPQTLQQSRLHSRADKRFGEDSFASPPQRPRQRLGRRRSSVSLPLPPELPQQQAQALQHSQLQLQPRQIQYQQPPRSLGPQPQPRSEQQLERKQQQQSQPHIIPANKFGEDSFVSPPTQPRQRLALDNRRRRSSVSLPLDDFGDKDRDKEGSAHAPESTVNADTATALAFTPASAAHRTPWSLAQAQGTPCAVPSAMKTPQAPDATLSAAILGLGGPSVAELDMLTRARREEAAMAAMAQGDELLEAEGVGGDGGAPVVPPMSTAPSSSMPNSSAQGVHCVRGCGPPASDLSLPTAPAPMAEGTAWTSRVPPMAAALGGGRGGRRFSLPPAPAPSQREEGSESQGMTGPILRIRPQPLPSPLVRQRREAQRRWVEEQARALAAEEAELRAIVAASAAAAAAAAAVCSSGAVMRGAGRVTRTPRDVGGTGGAGSRGSFGAGVRKGRTTSISGMFLSPSPNAEKFVLEFPESSFEAEADGDEGGKADSEGSGEHSKGSIVDHGKETVTIAEEDAKMEKASNVEHERERLGRLQAVAVHSAVLKSASADAARALSRVNSAEGEESSAASVVSSDTSTHSCCDACTSGEDGEERTLSSGRRRKRPFPSSSVKSGGKNHDRHHRLLLKPKMLSRPEERPRSSPPPPPPPLFSSRSGNGFVRHPVPHCIEPGRRKSSSDAEMDPEELFGPPPSGVTEATTFSAALLASASFDAADATDWSAVQVLERATSAPLPAAGIPALPLWDAGGEGADPALVPDAAAALAVATATASPANDDAMMTDGGGNAAGSVGRGPTMPIEADSARDRPTKDAGSHTIQAVFASHEADSFLSPEPPPKRILKGTSSRPNTLAGNFPPPPPPLPFPETADEEDEPLTAITPAHSRPLLSSARDVALAVVASSCSVGLDAGAEGRMVGVATVPPPPPAMEDTVAEDEELDMSHHRFSFAKLTLDSEPGPAPTPSSRPRIVRPVPRPPPPPSPAGESSVAAETLGSSESSELAMAVQAARRLGSGAGGKPRRLDWGRSASVGGENVPDLFSGGGATDKIGAGAGVDQEITCANLKNSATIELGGLELTESNYRTPVQQEGAVGGKGGSGSNIAAETARRVRLQQKFRQRSFCVEPAVAGRADDGDNDKTADTAGPPIPHSRGLSLPRLGSSFAVLPVLAQAKDEPHLAEFNGHRGVGTNSNRNADAAPSIPRSRGLSLPRLGSSVALLPTQDNDWVAATEEEDDDNEDSTPTIPHSRGLSLPRLGTPLALQVSASLIEPGDGGGNSSMSCSGSIADGTCGSNPSFQSFCDNPGKVTSSPPSRRALPGFVPAGSVMKRPASEVRSPSLWGSTEDLSLAVSGKENVGDPTAAPGQRIKFRGAVPTAGSST